MLSQDLVDELNLLFSDELSINKSYAEEDHSKRWITPFYEITIGNYAIYSLHNARKVKSEGFLMRNCVRNYIKDCVKGNYLFFSIKSIAGERVATLGVRRCHSYWVFDNCLGKNNTPVIQEEHGCYDEDGQYIYLIDYTELYSVAHEVVRLINTIMFLNLND